MVVGIRPQILPLLLTSVALESAVHAEQVAVHAVQLKIQTTWDGDPVDTPTLVKLTDEDGDLGVEVEAKFWNDPTNPGGKAGKPFFRLWDFEVVELFLLNDVGQHLVLLLDKGKDLRHSLPIEYSVSRFTNSWSGK